MWKKLISLSGVLVLIIGLSVSAAPYPGRMGVEAPGDVFVDIAREGYRWAKPDGAGGWTDLTGADVDADGWLMTDAQWVIDYRPVAEWAGEIDDPEEYRVDRSGTYKCSFIGQATLSHVEGSWTIQNQSYNSGTNTTTFDLVMDPPGPHHGIIVMHFTDTKRTPASPTGSGFTNFRCIRPGYPADTTQLFRDDIISTLTSADFAAVRFMGVAMTNGNVEWDEFGPITQSWSNRKKTTDASWGSTMGTLNKKDGWPWEYMIQLCNTVNMDLYICIPVAADDNYITQLAQLVHSNLNSGLNVYLEHSNEMWNWGFIQYAWNKAAAVEEVNAGGSNLNYDGSTNEEVWAQRRHARRVKQIVDIFASVFGSGEINNRIRGVLAGVSGDFFTVGRFDQMLDFLNAQYGAPSNYIYCTSSPLYYGGTAASGGEGTETYTVQQILDAMSDATDGQVTGRQGEINLASSWSLPGGFCSYEGGPDTGGGSTTNIGNRIMAVRNSQQADIYKRNFANNYWDLGGGLAMQFTLQGAYTRYGCWGLTDDLSNPDRNYLFQAVRDLIGSGGGPTLPGVATGPNPVNGATGVSVNADLSWTAGSGADSHDVYFGQSSPGTFQGNQAGTTYDPGTMANDTTYYWRIDEKNAVGTTTGTVWSFTTESAGGGLPSPWVNGDVGSPSQAGTASESSGTFTIEGGGADIWGTYDSFHYVYQSLSGDGEISARVASVENTDSWAKAGVMVRESLTGGSTHAMMVITAGNGAAFQRRTTTDGSSSHTAGSSVTAPYWVRLVRSGDTLTGYESSDGGAWNQVGSATVAMATDVYIGLAVTAHNDGTLCTTDISNVAVTGGGPQPPDAPTNLIATPGDGQVALNWTGSAGATEYNIYRGTGGNYYLHAETANTYYTDTSVTNGVTYYYYVTAENAAGESSASNGVTATPQAAPQPPGQASNPSPANGATSVNVDADLGWTAGSDATSHDVYFGQSSPGTFQGNQAGTTFDPGTLANSTTYYWRIDSVNAVGTTTGNVWSFTTAASAGGPVGYTWCASEGQTVVFSETVDVAYGADGYFNYMYGVTGSITFDNATFGDPIPGTVKDGYYKVVGGGGNGTGLTGDYYDNMDFTGFALTRVDATVNFNWGSGAPDASMGADSFSVQWTGQVEPLYSENYTFYTNSDDGVRLWVNGQSLIDNWTDHGPTEDSGIIGLTAGTKYDISMDFYENGGGAVAELRWSSPSQAKEVIPQTQLYEAEGGGTGTILREWWTEIGGNAISDLTSSPDYPDNPTGSDEPTSFEAPTDWADNYGTRISGYLHPTDSGDYTFWIASDDNGELWLSTNDNPANASLIANVPGWSSSRQWDKYAEQQSGSISLTGGNVYYIEALQKEGGGGDNLAVAWQGPGISQQVIPGDYLSPN